MKIYYFDTSVLVKLYHDESGSDEIEKIFSSESTLINISEIAVIELYSALYRLFRMKEISKDALEASSRSFEEDCKYRFVINPVDSNATGQAKEMIKRYGDKKSIRTLDAIQLSISLNNEKDVIFVSADKVLTNIAGKENLEILLVE